MAFHQIYLPVEDSPEEAFKAYSSMERALVLEVAHKFDQVGKQIAGQDWFRHLLNTDNHLPYRDKWKSQWDPTFIFGEVSFIASGQIRECLPVHNTVFTNAFDKARRIRNKWAHDFRPRLLVSVLIDAQWFLAVSTQAALEIQSGIQALISRIQGIEQGTWSPTDTAQVPIASIPVSVGAEKQFTEDDADREAEREAFMATNLERPVIGESWIGPIPSRKLRLQPRLHDVVDDVTGASIREELGDQADITIERWIQIRPSGELFASEEDGAVLGFVAGRPRLIGYIGPEPEYASGDIRGFALPIVFGVSPEGISTEESGTYLSEINKEAANLSDEIQKALAPGDELRITTHGDVISIGDYGIRKIAEANSSNWFPGQLVS